VGFDDEVDGGAGGEARGGKRGRDVDAGGEGQGGVDLAQFSREAVGVFGGDAVSGSEDGAAGGEEGCDQLVRIGEGGEGGFDGRVGLGEGGSAAEIGEPGGELVKDTGFSGAADKVELPAGVGRVAPEAH